MMKSEVKCENVKTLAGVHTHTHTHTSKFIEYIKGKSLY